MELHEFRQFAQDVAEYYGRKNLTSPRQVELWHEILKTIPAEPLEWIKKKIFADLDSMPANFPKVVRLYWGEWKNAHPDRVAWQEDQILCDAPGCEGGWLFVEKEGHRAVAVCHRCGVMRRLTTPGSPLLSSLDGLEEKGWRARVER